MPGPMLFNYFEDSQRAYQGARDQKRKSTLEQLAGDYEMTRTASPEFRSAVAQNGGDPSQYAKRDDDELRQSASYLLAAPEGMRQQVYDMQIAPRLKAKGYQVPPYSAEVVQMAQQLAGSSNGQRVQSTYVDAQGNRVGIMADGSTRILGQNAPNNQIFDTGNGVVGINKGSLQASPVMMGGGQPQAPQQPAMPGVQFDLAGTSPSYQNAVRGVAAGFVPAQVAPPQQLRSAPKAPAANPEEYGQPQTVMGADGKPQLVQFGNQGGQRPVSGVRPTESAQGRVSATQMRQANTAKAKLVDLQTVRSQLALVRQKFAPLQNTLSAGMGGGLLPTVDGKRFDAAVGLLQQQIRKLTRTPGEGSMSDWEGKLAMIANPSRGDYEEVTADKLDQLDALVSQLEQGYGALLQDNGGNADNLAPGKKQIKRTGMLNGRKVVEYTDGTHEYAAD